MNIYPEATFEELYETTTAPTPYDGDLKSLDWNLPREALKKISPGANTQETQRLVTEILLEPINKILPSQFRRLVEAKLQGPDAGLDYHAVEKLMMIAVFGRIDIERAGPYKHPTPWDITVADIGLAGSSLAIYDPESERLHFMDVFAANDTIPTKIRGCITPTLKTKKQFCSITTLAKEKTTVWIIPENTKIADIQDPALQEIARQIASKTLSEEPSFHTRRPGKILDPNRMPRWTANIIRVENDEAIANLKFTRGRFKLDSNRMGNNPTYPERAFLGAFITTELLRHWLDKPTNETVLYEVAKETEESDYTKYTTAASILCRIIMAAWVSTGDGKPVETPLDPTKLPYNSVAPTGGADAFLLEVPEGPKSKAGIIAGFRCTPGFYFDNNLMEVSGAQFYCIRNGRLIAYATSDAFGYFFDNGEVQKDPRLEWYRGLANICQANPVLDSTVKKIDEGFGENIRVLTDWRTEVEESLQKIIEKKRFIPLPNYHDPRQLYLNQAYSLRSQNGEQVVNVATLEFDRTRYLLTFLLLQYDNPIWHVDRELLELLDRTDLAPNWSLWEQPWPFPAVTLLFEKGNKYGLSYVSLARCEPQPTGRHLPDIEWTDSAGRIQNRGAVLDDSDGIFWDIADEQTSTITKTLPLKDRELDDDDPKIEASKVLCAKILAWLVYEPRGRVTGTCIRSGAKTKNPKKQKGALWNPTILKLPQSPETERYRADALAASGGGREQRGHWRRGHSKSQAYGPQRSQRKIIFVWPYYAGKEEEIVA